MDPAPGTVVATIGRVARYGAFEDGQCPMVMIVDSSSATFVPVTVGRVARYGAAGNAQRAPVVDPAPDSRGGGAIGRVI